MEADASIVASTATTEPFVRVGQDLGARASPCVEIKRLRSNTMKIDLPGEGNPHGSCTIELTEDGGAIALQGDNRIVFSKDEWDRFLRKIRKSEGRKGPFVMGVALPGAED